MVVFGGNDGARRSDVWAFSLSDPGHWTRLEPTGPGPSARYSHAAVYDPVRDRMIVFGGDDGHDRGDVWALSLGDAPTWSALTPAGQGPEGRRSMTAIYDPEGDRLLIFGGKRDSVTLFNDCWALTLGESPGWSRVDYAGEPPSPRYRHTAIHDPLRSRMVVFGGDDGEHRADVWALSLDASPRWRLLRGEGGLPAPRRAHTAVYDPSYDRMVVFGGADFDESENNTWGFSMSDSSWSSLTGYGPRLLRERHAAIFDPVARRMVVWGGSGPTVADEVIALSLPSDGGTRQWTRIDGPSVGKPLYDSRRDRLLVVGSSGNPNSQWIAELWELPLGVVGEWSRIDVAGSAIPRPSGQALAFDPVRDRLLLFGGYFYDPGNGSFTYSNDLWSVNLSGVPTWSRIDVPGARPREGFYRSALYDPVRDRLIVSGGIRQMGSDVFGEVWALALSGEPGWAQLPSLPPRSGSSAVYDPVRDRMLVFGGQDGLYGGTWASGETRALSLSAPETGWSVLPVTGEAPSRMYHAALYDPVRDRMVVFGGSPLDYYTRDNHVWTLSLSGAPEWLPHFPSAVPPLPAWSPEATYDPVRDRMIVFGGGEGWGDIRLLQWNAPARPTLACARDAAAAPGEGVAVAYSVANPSGGDRVVEWTLTAARAWPGYPLRGRVRIASAAIETVVVVAPVPDSAAEGRHRLTLAAWFSGAAGNDAVCAHEMVISTTGVLASLRFAETDGGRVRVSWAVEREGPVTVERNVGAGAWVPLASVLPDRGAVTIEDADIDPGGRHGYRLAWSTPGRTVTAGEVWIDVRPPHALALAGSRPHPVAGDFRIAFTLPRAGLATLELFDVTGRRAAPREPLPLGAGDHLLRMERWSHTPPGLYLVRLTFEGLQVSTRVLVSR